MNDHDFRSLYGSIQLRDRVNNMDPGTELTEKLRYVLSNPLRVRLVKPVRK